MLKSLENALRLSELREKLNALNAVAELTDAQRTEESALLASQKAVEVEYRGALQTEADADTTTTPDAETRERLQLVARASLGAIFARAVEHRATDGAESELQAALDLAPNQVPIDLLRAPVEHRAITPAPTHVGASEQPVLMPIFADGDAAFLGVDQVTVPAGDAVFPVLTNRPTVGGPHADSTEVAETTGAFTAELVKPERLQAAFTYRRVDVARFSAMGESLRQALNESLSESLDVQSQESAIDRLMTITGGIKVSPHVPAPASTKQQTIVRLGGRRDAVAGIWQGVTIIPDEITRAKHGEIQITAVLLAAVKVLRAGGFYKAEVKVA